MMRDWLLRSGIILALIFGLLIALACYILIAWRP